MIFFPAVSFLKFTDFHFCLALLLLFLMVSLFCCRSDGEGSSRRPVIRPSPPARDRACPPDHDHPGLQEASPSGALPPSVLDRPASLRAREVQPRTEAPTGRHENHARRVVLQEQQGQGRSTFLFRQIDHHTFFVC